MSVASKFFPAFALAVALSPAAAYARQHGPVQTNRVVLHYQGAQKSPSVDPVVASSETIDSPSAYYSYAPSGG